MRTSLKLFPALIMAVILTVGCASSNSKTLSDEEILEKVSPYLEQLVYQDPASYASLDDFLRANLGLDTTTVESVTLYLGAPNQNTGCFLMLTPAKDADLESIEASLEAKRLHGKNRTDGIYTGVFRVLRPTDPGPVLPCDAGGCRSV